MRVRTILLAALAACVVSSSGANGSVCVGDCRGNGRVGIADLLQGVNIALGRLALEACPAFAYADGAMDIDIAQLIRATRNALYGCPGVRFVDNSDGTISDLHTGLMWEKKVALGAGRDYGNLNAADNEYLIAGNCLGGGRYCQPSEVAGAACMEGAVPHKVPCSAGCDPILGIPVDCYTDEFSTSWEWLAQLNASRFARYSDWRIPTIEEWLTIIDHTRYDPALDRAFNGPECGPECTDVTRAACSCTHRCGTAPNFFATYRSASNNVAIPEIWPWWVNTCDGSTGHHPPVVGILVEQFVRAVRGRISSPSPRFIENGDGTVSDKQTGLMWQGAELMGNGVAPAKGGDETIYTPRFTWAGQCTGDPEMLCQPNSAAVAACTEGVQGVAVGCATCGPLLGICDTAPFGRSVRETVWERVAQLNAANMAGYRDWRIPTIAELRSIIDFSRWRPAWDPAFGEMHCNSCDGLPAWMIYAVWSATNLADDSLAVWGVLSEDGEITPSNKYGDAQVRLVRNERRD